MNLKIICFLLIILFSNIIYANVTPLKTYNIRAMYTDEFNITVQGKDLYKNTFSGSMIRRLIEPTKTKNIRLVNIEQKTIISRDADDKKKESTSLWVYDNNGSLRKITSSNATCILSETPTPIPTNAKIGDTGENGPYRCSDNTTLDEKWILEKASDSRAVFNMSFTKRDSSNNIMYIERGLYLIDSNGNIESMTTILYSPARNNSIVLYGEENSSNDIQNRK
jgi:hypothetical protein